MSVMSRSASVFVFGFTGGGSGRTGVGRAGTGRTGTGPGAGDFGIAPGVSALADTLGSGAASLSSIERVLAEGAADGDVATTSGRALGARPSGMTAVEGPLEVPEPVPSCGSEVHD